MKLSVLLVFSLALVASCASHQPEYKGLDGVKRHRDEAEKAYAASIADVVSKQNAKLDRPLKALYTPFPDDPRDLRNANVTGAVVTRFIIGEDGRVGSPTVVGKPNPTLSAITLHAIVRWRFEPPMIGGKATAIPAVQEFVYRIE